LGFSEDFRKTLHAFFSMARFRKGPFDTEKIAAPAKQP
jgi:hypothetical protein